MEVHDSNDKAKVVVALLGLIALVVLGAVITAAGHLLVSDSSHETRLNGIDQRMNDMNSRLQKLEIERGR